MNMNDFSKIAEENLAPGLVYYLKTRHGQGFVMAGESTIEGWTVELQKDAGFNPPLKKYRAGDIMNVPPLTGTFYEVKS